MLCKHGRREQESSNKVEPLFPLLYGYQINRGYVHREYLNKCIAKLESYKLFDLVNGVQKQLIWKAQILFKIFIKIKKLKKIDMCDFFSMILIMI